MQRGQQNPGTARSRPITLKNLAINIAIMVRVYLLKSTNVCSCLPLSILLVCGHFTQLVWKNSKKLGLGLAQVKESGPNGMASNYVVARYDPRGNFYMWGHEEEAYKANVGPIA